MELLSGVLLQHERYQIMEQLGEGGMATVYLAADQNLPGRMVAIKENRITTTDAQVQFQREAVILARLSHPNLPKVTDHFIEASGRQYLVMDYVTGEDLQKLTLKQRGFITESTAVDWISQVCDALTYMHTWIEQQTGKHTPVLHRDIKPSNIKCTPEGHIVLVDFGLAKFQSNANTNIDMNASDVVGTSVGARAYTPGYAPIEQYTGGTDVRSDIYALGATLYSILTSVKPPAAPSIAAGVTLISPRQLNPNISPHVEEVILRAMAIAPNARYQTANEMRMALLSPSRYASPSLHDATPTLHHADKAVTAPLTQPRSANANSAPHQVSSTPQTEPNTSQNRALPLWATIAALFALISVGIVLWYLSGPSLGQLDSLSGDTATSNTATSNAATSDTATSNTGASDIPNTALSATSTQVSTTQVSTTQLSIPVLSITQSLTTPVSVTDAIGRAAPPKQAVAGTQWTHEQDDAVYHFIPGGEFTMGSDEETKEDEGPAHPVSLDSYWIMQTEVTNHQYQRCVDDGGCTEPANTEWMEPAFAAYPATGVRWDQAVSYAAWVGGRLPTEAEWEKAARGNDQRTYPWGEAQPTGSLLNYRFEMTGAVAVGQYEKGASPFDVLDMAGNVEEWVQDWYDPRYYENAPAENPQGPDDGVMRVLRGGSFNSNPLDIRTTARGKTIPTWTFNSVGFRVVLDPVE